MFIEIHINFEPMFSPISTQVATMFEAKLKSAALLKKLVDAVKDIVADANFLCTDEGIQMQAMDSGHVALVTFTLLADGFLKYSCSKDMTLGIGMAGLAKALGCIDGSDSQVIRAEENGDSIYLCTEGVAGGKKTEFELRRLEIESDIMELPDVEYSASIKMPATEFSRIVRDISTIGDNCSIDVKEGEVIFGINGDIGNASFTVSEDKTSTNEDKYIAIDCAIDNGMRGAFGMRYLTMFTKATKLCESVGIYMSDGVPCF